MLRPLNELVNEYLEYFNNKELEHLEQQIDAYIESIIDERIRL